jgi:endonuclease G
MPAYSVHAASLSKELLKLASDASEELQSGNSEVSKNASYSKKVCDSHFFLNSRPKVISGKNSTDTQEMCFRYYSVLYSGKSRTSLWSAEHLTSDQLSAARNLERKDSFHPDANLQMYERAELADYHHAYKKDLTGIDRGHLSPNKDFPDAQSQYESFDLVNIVPQNSDNNEILWEGIESVTRELTYKVGELFVVTGPVYSNGIISNKLNERISIPSGVFKAIYNPASGQAAAYLTLNQPGMDYFVISISKLEETIGINVFPFLSQDAKNHAMLLGKPTPHKYRN